MKNTDWPMICHSKVWTCSSSAAPDPEAYCSVPGSEERMTGSGTKLTYQQEEILTVGVLK